jgi:hypothetical protein
MKVPSERERESTYYKVSEKSHKLLLKFIAEIKSGATILSPLILIVLASMRMAMYSMAVRRTTRLAIARHFAFYLPT